MVAVPPDAPVGRARCARRGRAAHHELAGKIFCSATSTDAVRQDSRRRSGLVPRAGLIHARSTRQWKKTKPKRAKSSLTVMEGHMLTAQFEFEAFKALPCGCVAAVL